VIRTVLKDFSALRDAVAVAGAEAPLSPLPRRPIIKHPAGVRQVHPPEPVEPPRQEEEPPRRLPQRRPLDGTLPDLEIEPGWTVESLKTIEECDDARLRLTEIIASIEAQISAATTKRQETGELADKHWWKRIQVALRLKRAALQRVQNIRGELSRKARESTLKSRERVIIDTLKSVDPAALYMAIGVAREAHPELFEAES
jgi:hypothetical protein